MYTPRRAGPPVARRTRAIAAATRRTLARVNSSAITARQPEVPKRITPAPPRAWNPEARRGFLTLRPGGPYNQRRERARRHRHPVHRLHRERGTEHRAGAGAARGGRLRQHGPDGPVGLPLEGEDLE